MYETYLFSDNRDFLKCAQERVATSKRAKALTGWDGAIHYASLSDDLYLLYQLAKSGDGWAVVDMHMILFGAEKTLRKDVCKVAEFWRPEEAMLWHSAVCYEERTDIPFAVTNAWMGKEYEKYSKGGNFVMTFSGIGSWMECVNNRGTVRFFEGNPVELARQEKNDPTIDHVDVGLSELRSLNSDSDPQVPAGAEFTGIVEECETIRICGVKCYKILLWSGAPGERSSFPWSLLIAEWCIDGHYVPRVGDAIHGHAFMFGTFHGDAQKKPTIVMEDRLPMRKEEPPPDADMAEAADDTEPDEPTDAGKGWKYLPREPADYPQVEDHGGGLLPSVRKRLPKFVVYSDYKKAMKGDLAPLKMPGRKELRRIVDSIDYVLTSDNNRRMFASVMDAIGIRHFVLDRKTGERHLWCCLPSALWPGRFHTNLLIALDAEGQVLRYTLYMGEWDWHRLAGGLELTTYSFEKKAYKSYGSMSAALRAIPKMKKDDFIIAAEQGHTAMLQAYCADVVDGIQHFAVEWQIHHLVWQFRSTNVNADQVVAMMQEFDASGIEPVQTMARWKWCKMKGNV